MSETIFTALGRDPSRDEPKGFAGVTWKIGDRKYNAWLELKNEELYSTYLPRVFDWAVQACQDMQRKDGGNFFNTYFVMPGEVSLGGIPLKRRYSDRLPLDNIEPEEIDTEEAGPGAAPAAQG